MRSHRRILAAIAIIGAIFAVIGVAPVVRAETDDNESAFEIRLLERINAARAKQSLDVLDEHPDIRDQAREHSTRMSTLQALSDTGFEARKARIANADPGINEEKICELRASANLERIGPVVEKVYRAWKRSAPHKRCLFDSDFTTQSGAVGAEFDGEKWWITLIAARDATLQ